MGIRRFFRLDSFIYYRKYANPFVIEIGSGLIPLVVEDKREELLKQIQSLRKNLSKEKRIVVPKIRILDNCGLKPNQFRIITSYIGEVKLNADELSDGAGAITADLKDIIVRLYEGKNDLHRMTPN